MSQLSIARIASRTTAGTRWWHLSFTTGSLDVADGIVEKLVTPLVAQAHLYGAKRWYFTRSGSPARMGGMIRLSIHAHPRVLDRLRSDRRVLEEGAARSLPIRTARERITAPVDATYYCDGDESADPHLENDLVKYGGVSGLGLAEEVFELSSDLGLWAVQRFPRMQGRSALGAVLLFDTAQSLLHGPRAAGWPERRADSWDAYWDSHLRTCTADAGPRAPAVREGMAARVSAKAGGFHALMSAIAVDSAARAWRRRWSRAVDGYLYRAGRSGVSRTAGHLTVHQAHMMLNRLGCTAHEEAALGLYARSWQPVTAIGRAA